MSNANLFIVGDVHHHLLLPTWAQGWHFSLSPVVYCHLRLKVFLNCRRCICFFASSRFHIPLLCTIFFLAFQWNPNRTKIVFVPVVSLCTKLWASSTNFLVKLGNKHFLSGHKRIFLKYGKNHISSGSEATPFCLWWRWYSPTASPPTFLFPPWWMDPLTEKWYFKAQPYSK